MVDQAIDTGMFEHTRSEFVRTAVRERVLRLIAEGWIQPNGCKTAD